MTTNPHQPISMVSIRQRLRDFPTDAPQHAPLLYSLATALTDKLPKERCSPHEFVARATTVGPQVYKHFGDQARVTLLAQHVPTLARAVCPPDFAATVTSMYERL